MDLKMAKVIAMIESALRAQGSLSERVAAIRRFVDTVDDEGPEWEIARDLVWDLAFYEPDPIPRAEDGSFYGDDRLRALLLKALEQLRNCTK